jgi:hypothetical protein
VTVLLKKIAGNSKIDKSRAICLLEADFNCTANELLARHKFLLAKLLVTFFANRIANRVGVRPFLGGVRYSFSTLTYMLVISDECLSPDLGANKFTNKSI